MFTALRRRFRRVADAFREHGVRVDARGADFVLRMLCAWNGVLLLPSLGLIAFGVWMIALYTVPGAGFWSAILAGLVLMLAATAFGLAFVAISLWMVALRALATFRRGSLREAGILAGLWAALGIHGAWVAWRGAGNPDGPFFAFAWAAATVPGGIIGLVALPLLVRVQLRSPPPHP